MKQSKWLHILVAVVTVLLLGVGLQGGNSPPAIAGPAPAPANAPLLLGSGGVFSIAGTGFVPMSSDTDYDYQSWGGVSLAGGYRWMSASVELPSGATVTSLTFYWEDNSAEYDMRLRLRRHTRDPVYEEMGVVSSSGSGGMGSTITTTISSPVVDNNNYAYVLYVSWQDAVGSDLTAYGAKITYYPTLAATALADLALSPEDAFPSAAEYPPSPDSQATVTVGPESASESVQIPEEGPVLHTGGEIIELASSPPSQDVREAREKEGSALSIETGSAPPAPSDVGALWGEPDWQYYSVAGSNFHPLYPDTAHSWASGGGRYVTGGIPWLVVPLDLPHGSVIQQVKVTFWDNAAQNATWFLYQVDRQSNGSTVWQATTTGTGQICRRQYSPKLEQEVDNQNYAYYFQATLSPTAGANLRVQEVAIGYINNINTVYLPIILKNY